MFLQMRYILISSNYEWFYCAIKLLVLDYLNPDAIGEEVVAGPQEHHNTLQLPSNLTDTGEWWGINNFILLKLLIK